MEGSSKKAKALRDMDNSVVTEREKVYKRAKWQRKNTIKNKLKYRNQTL